MNLDQFVEKINKAKEDVKLPGSTKSETRGTLLNFIELRPLAPRIKKVSVSAFPFLRPMPVLASVAILVLMSAGVSFAAEKSLPGQLLYAVKVNFNEEIVGALNVTAVGKANWDAKRAERRLAEVSKITSASESEFAEGDKVAKLEQKFEEHAVKVRARIEKMEAQGKVRNAAAVANKFEASLRAHEEILERIHDKKVGDSQTIATLKVDNVSAPSFETRLKEKLVSIEAQRMMLEAKIATGDEEGDEEDGLKEAAESRLTFAKLKIEELQKFLDANRDNLSIESSSEIETRITSAKEVLLKGRNYADEGFFGEAYNLANEAIKITQGTSLLLGAKLELNLNGDAEPVFVPMPPISTSSPEDAGN